MLLIRRKLSFLENTLTMITTAFADIINGVVLTKLSKDSLRNIRSLNDRVTYLKNNVENMYQRVINLREAYNSSLNANLNETIRTLTVIATIILPLTLITGIYGMNFDVMPELHSPLGYYYSLLLMVGVLEACSYILRTKNGFNVFKRHDKVWTWRLHSKFLFSNPNEVLRGNAGKHR